MNYYLGTFLTNEYVKVKEEILESTHKKDKLIVYKGIILDILNRNLYDMVNEVKYEVRSINSANIPQYSSFDDATINLLMVLDCESEGITFEELGYQLRKKKGVKSALVKYGENHAKLGELLGLVYINKSIRPNTVNLTEIGQIILALNDKIAHEIYNRLIIRIPIIQQYMLNKEIDLEKLMECYLSNSTAKRRLSNVQELISIVEGVEIKCN